MDSFELLQNVGIFTIGTYFIKSVFSNYFNQDIENYKATLKKEQVIFTNLHEKRAVIITELYSKMAMADRKIGEWINPLQVTSDEKIKARQAQDARQAYTNLRDFYEQNRIYFKKSTNELLDNIIKELNGIIWNFSTKEETPREKTKIWRADWDKLTKGEVSKLKVELEGDFAEILGVEQKNEGINKRNESISKINLMEKIESIIIKHKLSVGLVITFILSMFGYFLSEGIANIYSMASLPIAPENMKGVFLSLTAITFAGAIFNIIRKQYEQSSCKTLAVMGGVFCILALLAVLLQIYVGLSPNTDSYQWIIKVMTSVIPLGLAMVIVNEIDKLENREGKDEEKGEEKNNKQ